MSAEIAVCLGGGRGDGALGAATARADRLRAAAYGGARAATDRGPGRRGGAGRGGAGRGARANATPNAARVRVAEGDGGGRADR